MPVKKKTAKKKAVRKTAKKKTGKVPPATAVPTSAKGFAVDMNPETDKEAKRGKEST
ncbi:hypothetical protein [Leptospira borgpetersenii]|uniref:hypothetical protein n=1 Tax=Leptospira borgpetersenii TaxID=174 RepID=UPI00187F912D|nr:hypothetical protein [Leptospira borgpetersenii]MBE8363474.1 hypothetical protein [Leptospira borgpetersenii serovar Balcanica]MBE8367084.1 hypothetical protein [Leptospira borgpetersenii serovar Balcanica]MBE8422495.1 hypothetical protein [Leptospira borgpetersenii serovar Balcanica]MBF3349604.1 hypothetical protein [Leptospira borgpetersenii serovar Balcanica]